MPRPRKMKLVSTPPPATFFKPQGVPLSNLKGVVLPVEGLEALRLADWEGLDQAEAAARMGISPATFCRVLAEARRITARALSQGLALRIEGGNFRYASQTVVGPARDGSGISIDDIYLEQGGSIMPNRDGTGPDGQGPRGRGKGRGQGQGQGQSQGQGQGRAGGRGQGQGQSQGRGQGKGRGQSGGGRGQGRG